MVDAQWARAGQHAARRADRSCSDDGSAKVSIPPACTDADSAAGKPGTLALEVADDEFFSVSCADAGMQCTFSDRFLCAILVGNQTQTEVGLEGEVIPSLRTVTAQTRVVLGAIDGADTEPVAGNSPLGCLASTLAAPAPALTAAAAAAAADGVRVVKRKGKGSSSAHFPYAEGDAPDSGSEAGPLFIGCIVDATAEAAPAIAALSDLEMDALAKSITDTISKGLRVPNS